MDLQQIKSVFFPYASARGQEMKAKNRRLVYYTSADTAYKIIKNREIWMRSTETMNDYSEVEHGFQCLSSALDSPNGEKFRNSIESACPGLFGAFLKKFDAWAPGIRQDTFIVCLSAHQDTEDHLGRLSMWRAYGGQTGVALVVNSAAMFIENEHIGISSSPVAYWDNRRMTEEVGTVGDNILNNIDQVRTLSPATIENILFTMFRMAVLCTKHPGFEEEREWRIIFSPALEKSPLLTQSLEVIRGIPQTIQKLSFSNKPELGLNGLDIVDLLDRVIIGPCEYPEVMSRAFRSLLEDQGFLDFDRRVVESDIPLRVG